MARPSIKKYFEKGKVVEVTHEEHDTIPLPAITFCPSANDRDTKILCSKILYIFSSLAPVGRRLIRCLCHRSWKNFVDNFQMNLVTLSLNLNCF